RAGVVVDAGGAGQPLRRPAGRVVTADQTAYGVVVPAEAAAPLVAPGEALFMDWRPDHGRGGWPSFLYGVPLDGSRVLLEETSLARRPGLGLPELRERLHARLAHHGVPVAADAEVERVRFPVDVGRHRGAGVLGFGAAAPLVHPASGFSVAGALALAPRVAGALAGHLPDHPDRALAAARAVVWPAGARAVHRFRRIGLEALLRMPPADVPVFFERFFALPEHHRWNYLTAREDLRATAATMTALFARAEWRLRLRLVLPALLPPAAPLEPPLPPRPTSLSR
uniref:lycopene cyclase family protein n=1 Tax=Pseudonocardia lacus TaxID=2835865 RepID=UPI001BDCBD0E